MNECRFCSVLERIRSGEAFPNLIAELPTGYVLLHLFQRYPGYCLFVSKQHADELDELPVDFVTNFQADMLRVHTAVRTAMKPAKMNVSSLGNEIAHVHWHITPRYADDEILHQPIWALPKTEREKEEFRPSAEQQAELIKRIREALEKG